MFDHLLEASRWDDTNQWSNIGFGEEMYILEIIIGTLSGTLKIQKILTDNACLLQVFGNKPMIIHRSVKYMELSQYYIILTTYLFSFTESSTYGNSILFQFDFHFFRTSNRLMCQTKTFSANLNESDQHSMQTTQHRAAIARAW